MSSTPIRVFISYASRYKGWAQVLHGNLDRVLTAAGRSPRLFLDQVDLAPGRSWINQLQAGLDGADHLVLVATPEAMASCWVEAEWQGFAAERPQWQGCLHVAWLVETPVPSFLASLQRVDFQRHEADAYRKALGALASSLLGQAAPEPEGIEIPLPPPAGLPAALREQLLDWIEPMLAMKALRRAIAASIKLRETALDDHPSKRCAASAALVWATRDDDDVAAALRVVDALVELFADDEPERVGELEPLREQLRELAQGPSLLDRYRDRVAAEHEKMVPYFQQHAELELLERVYVQLELRPDSPAGAGDETLRSGRPLGLRQVLELDPQRYRWVSRRWVVRGDPGAGKTTLLRHLASTVAREAGSPWVPVFASLQRMMREREPLLERLERQMALAGWRGLGPVLEREAQQGRLLLLLDGLDEVPRGARREAELLLSDLSARWPKTPIVVTTRPIGYRRPEGGFLELDLLPLDADHRREFLGRWFGRKEGKQHEERAAAALAVLEADAALSELAGNPLYLTLMAMLLETGSSPERNRTRLYDQVFGLLMQGGHRDPAKPMDLQDASRRMLRYLGHGMTEDNRDAEPVAALEARLYKPEADELRAPLERQPRWRSTLRPFLHDLAEHTGILGPHDGPDTDWRFWHRTFREALAAERLEEMLAGEGGQTAILEHARGIAGDESRWAEPYALLAGRVEKPDDLVRALVKENRALGLRAVATAQGLGDATLNEVLELSDKWRERIKVYPRIPELLGDPERALALLDRLRRRTRDGNDLYFIDVAIADAADRWEDVRPRAKQLRARLYDHIPAPPEELFRSVETPHDGRVALWREIPAGRFLMGSPEDEEGRYDHEGPQHEVTITAPFALAAVPVTNAQYAAFDPALADARQPNRPVVNVTWYAAVSFCRWLSASLPWAEGARLPTEEEWEHACRAGTTTRFWSGDSEDDLARVDWYRRNSKRALHPVGEKPANPWGLYDVHGNVLEWTAGPLTDYAEREASIQHDPTAQDDHAGHPSAPRRVVRGGSFLNDARNARSAYRFLRDPGIELQIQGFRVLLPRPPEL